MKFSMKFGLVVLLFAATAFVAADESETETPGTNGTAPAVNGTEPAGNGTLAGNGTATTNGTNSTNGTTDGDAPEASSGATAGKREYRDCEYSCPPDDLRSQAYGSNTTGVNTFTCVYGKGTCSYRQTSGVLSEDNDNGACRHAATCMTAGCNAGQSNNGGVAKRRSDAHKRQARRSSWELQYAAMARSNGL
ncbi:hypothetical protein AURDEDRAFT_110402 [Auricularia subglabra TFB-10046 SS5]|nr:hypothetical protein AURDEDRAFT_110402 [Auricularia subglabra TFB-10046 SS5]